MAGELTQDEIRLRVHAGADTNQRVRGKVFARQLFSLINTLEATDRIANGGVSHDYVITGLERKSAEAYLTQIVSSKKAKSSSPLALLPVIIDAVMSQDTATVIRFADAISNLRKMAKGAGATYSHADLQINGAASIRVDEFFERRLQEAVRISKPEETKFYSGTAYGSFDGIIKEIDLRGDAPRLKLILAAGGLEIDCVSRGLSLEEIRASLDARAWVDGRAFYNGESGLPERIEIMNINLVSQRPNLLRWGGTFKEIKPTDWGETK